MYCAREGDKDESRGASLVVESLDDLEYASQTLPGATEIYELKKAPGGGRGMTFRDPVDNFPFHLVYGPTPVEDTTTLPQLKYNFVCSSWPSNDHNANQVGSPQANTDREITPRDSSRVSTLDHGQIASNQRNSSCSCA